MGRNKQVTEKDIKEFVRLYKSKNEGGEGKKVSEIEKITGYSAPTIYNYLKDWNKNKQEDNKIKLRQGSKKGKRGKNSVSTKDKNKAMEMYQALEHTQDGSVKKDDYGRKIYKYDIEEILKKCNISRPYLYQLRRDNNIPKRDPKNKKGKLSNNKEKQDKLIKEYFEKPDKPIKEIIKEEEISRQAFFDLLEVRGINPNRKNRKKRISEILN